MRARKPSKPPLPPPEAKDLHRSPTAKDLADPSSAVCYIARALPQVPSRPQLPRLQYPLDHLPPWLQAHHQPREICLSISMILRRKGFWTSSYTWALRKIKLPTIQTLSSPGLHRNRLQLASLLLLVTTTSLAHLRRLLLVYQPPRPLQLVLRIPELARQADVGHRRRLRHEKVGLRQQRNPFPLHPVNHPRRQHQPGCSEHLLQLQTLASMLSLLDQHRRGDHERHQMLPRAHHRPPDPRRRQWKIAQASRIVDLEYLPHSLASARSLLHPHLQAEAPFLAALRRRRLVQRAQPHLPIFRPKFPIQVHRLAFLHRHQLEPLFSRLRRQHLAPYHPRPQLPHLLHPLHLTEDLRLR